MICWDEWQYSSVAADLSLGPWSAKRPANWHDGLRSIEATTQTLLGLHLSELTGMPLRLLHSAGAIESTADLVATDALARVHLFELKMNRINDQAVTQIERYLLRHVFEDAGAFLSDARARGHRQFTDFEIAKTILGVYANDRPEGFGFSLVQHIPPENPLAMDPAGHRMTRTRWRRVSEPEKLERMHLALTSMSRNNRNSDLPSVRTVEQAAGSWGAVLREGLDRTGGSLLSERRLVIWLVGASVSDGALERVRLWRRAGVDARLLTLTARMPGQQWVLGVRRELAPMRDAAERGLLAQSLDTSEARLVKAVFYEEVAPAKNRRHGGDVLESPIIGVRD